MKSSNKSSLITGIILLLIAALFSISLILQLLDFGIGGPGHNNFLYLIGDVFYSVYGFCSILIPLFLFIAGLSCFASKWNSQRTMLLLTALIPFFTAVVTEKICRAIFSLGYSTAALVKMIIAIITGLMLIIIEVIGVQYIAESINQKLFHSPKKNKADKVKSKSIKDFNVDFKEHKEDSDLTQTDEPSEPDTSILTDEDVTDEFEDKKSVKEKLSEKFGKKGESSFKPEKIRNPSIFAKIKSSLKAKKQAKEEAEKLIQKEYKVPQDEVQNVSENENVENQEAILQKQQDEMSFYNLNMDDIPQEEMPTQEQLDLAEAKEQLEADEFTVETSNFNSVENTVFEEEKPEETEDEDSEPANPASVITQEEFAALINPVEDKSEEPAVDEIEWNNVPPAPATLPPEYQEDFDVNDPALQFPPSEEPEPSEPAYEKVIPASKFTSGINLHDDNYTEEKEDSAMKYKPDYEKQDYTSNIDFSKDTLSSASEKFEAAKETSLSPDFYDVDLNDENLEEEIERKEAEEEALSVPPVIAKNSLSAESEASFEPDEKTVGISDSTESAVKAVNPNSGATNLTADNLTDFFNAQQALNTPKTQTIQGNLPADNKATKKGPYVIPSDLLTAYEGDQYWIIDEKTKQASINLKQTLSEFNIEADIIGIKKGPVVTMFELLPAPGVKLSKIVALQDNIALSLAASSVRIVAPIPGKQAVGIEVPNKERSIVGFREIIEMDLPEYNKMAVPVVLGKDILGKAQLIDLVKTPHMLIAGATGSGKSVCVNSLILSILYKRSYKDVKLILVDPKVVELKLYNNIPHLLTPVITEPKKALQALQYCLCEMERRYALLDGMGVRDISNYNQKIKEQNIATEKLPYIVVIIDEFADLMATSGKELESIVARLTAMSRAVGIHLVLATQRPSVNVITGLIKANIPTRIAFMVASRTDSNIIIDSVGAEKLLGRGDMLYASAVDPYPVRIQGTFVSDQEVEDVVEYVKQYGEPDYIDDEIFVDDDDDAGQTDLFGNPASDEDPLYDQALEIVVQAGKASASYIQRRLKIGYNRAARLVEEMEERGIVGPANGSKPREIIHIP